MPHGDYDSFTPALAGMSARTFGTGSYSDSTWTVFNTSDYTGLLQYGIDPSPNRDAFYAA